jgi:nucleoside-diphosphate-sugar epimerase
LATTYALNEKATIRLAELAVRPGSDVSFFLELQRLRRGTSGLGRETSPTNPVTPYGASKYQAERRLLANNRQVLAVLLRSATATASRHASDSIWF